MIVLFVLLALVLALAAWFLLRKSAAQQQEAGLPLGRIVFSDTGAWDPVEKPFYDSLLRLTGKPDYLVQEGHSFTPVEVKSSPAPSTPFESHIYQLAAYCLLVERATGKRPAYGMIHYRNRTFALDYTQDLEAALLDTLADIRIMERRGNVNRSHDEPARCRSCGYKTACNQKLE